MAPWVSRAIRVLTVDDQPLFRSAARDVISATPGFSLVGEAASGTEALREVERLDPELVLLDVNMPGMDVSSRSPGACRRRTSLHVDRPDLGRRPAQAAGGPPARGLGRPRAQAGSLPQPAPPAVGRRSRTRNLIRFGRWRRRGATLGSFATWMHRAAPLQAHAARRAVGLRRPRRPGPVGAGSRGPGARRARRPPVRRCRNGLGTPGGGPRLPGGRHRRRDRGRADRDRPCGRERANGGGRPRLALALGYDVEDPGR